MKKRILLLCLCLIAALFVVVYAVIQKIESQYNEMDYFLISDLYQVSYAKKENMEDCSFTFDFNDPKSAVGQTIYDKNGCKLFVSGMEENEEFPRYKVKYYFTAMGDYNRENHKGVFISPVLAVPDENNVWQLKETKMEVEPSEKYRCWITSQTCEYEEMSNRFSVGITFMEDDVNEDETREVILHFKELWEVKWERKQDDFKWEWELIL